MSELKPCTLTKALEDIIHRSNNGELGTSKVLDMRRIAEDALKNKVPDKPKAKALEWTDDARHSRTHGILGENYVIDIFPMYCTLWLDRDDQCSDLIGKYETLEAAKSAAQSYYETQILEALE